MQLLSSSPLIFAESDVVWSGNVRSDLTLPNPLENTCHPGFAAGYLGTKTAPGLGPFKSISSAPKGVFVCAVPGKGQPDQLSPSKAQQLPSPLF